MRAAGLVGVHRRTGRVSLTRQDAQATAAADLIGRDFTAAAPNLRWTADITYVPTGEGWLYLAVVLDLFARRIVGWAMADHMRTELVTDALAMAVATRRPGPGLVHHNDAGSQGGFNWSLQHLDGTGACCGEEKVACGGSGRSSTHAVTGAASGQPAGGSAALLAKDRRGALQRGRCHRVRSVDALGAAVVS